jgi:8-oxo-dGTP pyrophosphatase MutT (NUDIX family)
VPEAPGSQVLQECVEGYLFSGRPPQILVLRRPPNRGQIWVPVSGKVDVADADFLSALRRELREETGFEEFRRVFPLDWTVEFPGGPNGEMWRLHAYGVELDRTDPPTLSREHEAFEWVTPEEAGTRLHYLDNRAAVRRLLTKMAELDESSTRNA